MRSGTRCQPTNYPALIATVHGALASIEGGGGPEPAVPIRRSIQPDYFVCLDCGRHQKMLRRHLMNSHELSPRYYRKRWGLKDDYQLVAPNYKARRSELGEVNWPGTARQKATQPDGPAIIRH